MEIRQVLKENVKFFRKRAGYTQQGLAEACEVTTAYIGEIEIGRKYVSLQMIEKLSQCLRVEPWQLFLPPELKEKTLSRLLAEELRETVTLALEDVLPHKAP